MEYDIISHPDHVEVRARGDFALDAAKSLIAQLAMVCTTHGQNRVLVDCCELTTEVSTGARFLVAEQLAASLPRGVRVAFLASAQLNKPSKVLENTANNRGAMVLATASHEEATAFLGLRGRTS
jgi:hypothetical protein